MDVVFCTSLICNWNGYESDLTGGDCPDCGQDVVMYEVTTEEDTDDE